MTKQQFLIMVDRFIFLTCVPGLLFAVLVDLILGDLVTGIKVSTSDKLQEHKSMWLEHWNRGELK